MRTTIVTTIAAAALLSACSMPVYRDGNGNAASQRDVMACDYEAQKATAGINDSFRAGWMQAEISRSCLVARGFQRSAQ